MAASRKPGPIGTDGNVVDVNDGTLVRNLSPLPGSTGHQSTQEFQHLHASGGRHKPRSALATLSLRARGSQVRWAQILLNQHAADPPLKSDGIFGPEMNAAVVTFQRSLRLRPDGVIGPQTWAKLVVTGESARISAGQSAAPATAKQAESVADWSFSQRFEKVLKLVPSHLTPELAAQFRAMLNPTTIAFAGSTFGALAVAQFFGVGEVVDAFLFGVGVATLGAGAFEGGKAIGDCLMATLEAKDPSDLDKAAADFAKGVVLLGITTIFALLMNPRAKSAPAAASEEAAASPSPAAAEGRAPPPPPAPKPLRPKLAEEPPPAPKPPPIPPDPMKLAAALRDAPQGSPERAALADQFAKISTHVQEPADRVVLGKWSEGGGYVAEAQKNGGVWYETPKGTYQVMGKDAAWETNEAFLKQQMASGKPLAFTGMTEDEVASQLADLQANGQPIESAPARIREFVFTQNNAANYGYVQNGMTFAKGP